MQQTQSDRENILKLYPFGAWLRRAHTKRVVKIATLAHPGARTRLRMLKQISAIDTQARANLTSKIAHSAARVSLLQARRRNAEDRMFIPPFCLLVLIWLSTPIAVVWLSGRTEPWVYICVWLGSLLLMGILSALAATPVLLFPHSRQVGIFWFVFGLCTYAFVFYLLVDRFDLHNARWYVLLTISAFAQLLLYIGGAILIVTFLRAIGQVLSSRLEHRIPDALFIDSLLSALSIVSTTDSNWTELRSKAKLMRTIEQAARIVEKQIPRVLRASDPYTDSWLEDRFQRIGAALRAKKYWIGMPKPDSRYRLQENLIRSLIDAANGHWDSLDWDSHDSTANRQLWRSKAKVRLGALALGIATAFIPAAIYRGAQELKLLQGGILNDYLGVGVVIWAAIAFLLAVDPRFGEKVEALQKIASSIPGIKKMEDS